MGTLCDMPSPESIAMSRRASRSLARHVHGGRFERLRTWSASCVVQRVVPDFLRVVPIRDDTVFDNDGPVFATPLGLAATEAIVVSAVDLGANR